MRDAMNERGSVYTLVGFVISIIVAGFVYTLIRGVLGAFPAGPGTTTMQFLDFVLTYFMLPALIIIVLWYLNSMQKKRYMEVPG